MDAESKFKFKAKDLVKCAFFGDEVFELIDIQSATYPLKIKKGTDEFIFSADGRYYVTHTHSILTLVYRPKEKESVTWYSVCYHAKEMDAAREEGKLFRSKEHFLVYQGRKKATSTSSTWSRLLHMNMKRRTR